MHSKKEDTFKNHLPMGFLDFIAFWTKMEKENSRLGLQSRER